MLKQKPSILNELYQLQQIHNNSKIDNHIYQPNSQEQRNLIIKSITVKLINNTIKKEKLRYLFNERNKDDIIKINQLSRPNTEPNLRTNSSSKRKNLKDKNTNNNIRIQRPMTASSFIHTNNQDVPKHSYASSLIGTTANEDFNNEFNSQVTQQYKNSKVVFESLINHCKGNYDN